MRRLRVLVVEDSVSVRRRLCEVLASDSELDVVGEAGDGQVAIAMCRSLRPDVITLDMLLPHVTGLEATEQIMAECPTPILIVSSSVNRGDLFKTYDALAAGAVDVFEKPTGTEPEGEWEHRFLTAVKRVSRIRVITHPRARLGGLGRSVGMARPVEVQKAPNATAVLGIGASTGGPGALAEVLRAIPPPAPCPIFMLLHIDDPFGTAFAEWIDKQTGHRVVLARDGERVATLAGRVTMAPANVHTVVEQGFVRLTTEAERHSCRPSIDVLFESLAREFGSSATACLLTGMGRDGAAGLLAVRKAGGTTLAQDEATSVVYGMPREAAALGAAMRVLPLPEIGPALSSLLRTRQGAMP